MKIHYIILALMAVGLTACDCYVKVAGQVLSSSTGKPISDAQIIMLGRNRMVKTDADGKFMIDQVTGFCFNPELEITKEGFKPFIISLISESDFKSYRVKSDLEHFEFDEKVYPDSLNKTHLSLRLQSTGIARTLRVEAIVSSSILRMTIWKQN